MPHFAVSAIGRDRPGIVAGISEGLLQVQGNIEDSRMSILRGHFAVMLIVSVPDSVEPEHLARRLDAVRERLGLEALAVNAVDSVAPRGGRPSHVVSVYGADHPGIVHAVTSALAERSVNVTDLHTRLAGAGDHALYVMIMEVALGDADASEVESALRQAGRAAEVEVSLRPLGADAL